MGWVLSLFAISAIAISVEISFYNHVLIPSAALFLWTLLYVTFLLRNDRGWMWRIVLQSLLLFALIYMSRFSPSISAAVPSQRILVGAIGLLVIYGVADSWNYGRERTGLSLIRGVSVLSMLTFTVMLVADYLLHADNIASLLFSTLLHIDSDAKGRILSTLDHVLAWRTGMLLISVAAISYFAILETLRAGVHLPAPPDGFARTRSRDQSAVPADKLSFGDLLLGAIRALGDGISTGMTMIYKYGMIYLEFVGRLLVSWASKAVAILRADIVALGHSVSAFLRLTLVPMSLIGLSCSTLFTLVVLITEYFRTNDVPILAMSACILTLIVATLALVIVATGTRVRSVYGIVISHGLTLFVLTGSTLFAGGFLWFLSVFVPIPTVTPGTLVMFLFASFVVLCGSLFLWMKKQKTAASVD